VAEEEDEEDGETAELERLLCMAATDNGQKRLDLPQFKDMMRNAGRDRYPLQRLFQVTCGRDGRVGVEEMIACLRKLRFKGERKMNCKCTGRGQEGGVLRQNVVLRGQEDAVHIPS
jgi:hypothetical protein